MGKKKGIDRWTPLKNPGIIHESRYGSVPALPQKKSLLSGGWALITRHVDGHD